MEHEHKCKRVRSVEGAAALIFAGRKPDPSEPSYSLRSAERRGMRAVVWLRVTNKYILAISDTRALRRAFIPLPCRLSEVVT